MKLRVIYFWFFMLVMMQAYCQSLPRRTVAGKREPRFRNLTRAGLSPVLAAPNGGVGSGIAPDPIRSKLQEGRAGSVCDVSSHNDDDRVVTVVPERTLDLIDDPIRRIKEKGGMRSTRHFFGSLPNPKKKVSVRFRGHREAVWSHSTENRINGIEPRLNRVQLWTCDPRS